MHIMQQVSFSFAGRTFSARTIIVVFYMKKKISRFVVLREIWASKKLTCITMAHYEMNTDAGNRLGTHLCHGTCHHLSNFDISAVSTHAVISARQTRSFKSKHMQVYIYCMHSFPYILSFTDSVKKNVQKAVSEYIFLLTKYLQLK